METPNILQKNVRNAQQSQQDAMNNTKKDIIVIDYDEERNTCSEFLEKSEIFITDNMVSGYIHITVPFFVSEISKKELEDDTINSLPIGTYNDISLYYNVELKKALFLGTSNDNKGKVSYSRIKQPFTIENPYSKSENDRTITLSDENGNLLKNFVIESNSSDEIICSTKDGILVFKAKDESPDRQAAENLGIVIKEIYKIKNLPVRPITCIVKKDVYLLHGSFTETITHTENGKEIIEYLDIDFILDGGNLYRYHKLCPVPKRIICKNGTYIDIPSKSQRAGNDSIGGANATYIKNPDKNTSLKLFGGQNNVVVEFNPMDFVYREDYEACNSASSINLNNVLDRIFSSIYNRNNLCQRMVIKMPETHYGHTSFYLDRPVVIPYNVTLDMSGATVCISTEFVNKIREKNALGLDILNESGEPGGYVNDVDFVFAFGTNSVHAILASSIVKNMSIRFENANTTKHLPHKIFDLTNFFGVMENVYFDLGARTDVIALWQPFGSNQGTYSDQKIIRRCKVQNHGWRSETPVAIFCAGDGCIIEQCILGYVAIICGNSYTIRGCLNDSYFLYDTTVDFSGSYWEMGQFQILDSKVSFSNCRLNASNNHFELSHDTGYRRFFGPWMAIDTEGCRKRLINMFKKHKLDLNRFNQVEIKKPNGQIDGGQLLGRATSQFSTVQFNPTINACLDYWGHKQPMASPLIKAGKRAQIIGLENLESLGFIFIHNYIPENKGNSSQVPDTVTVTVTQPSIIPLVNGKFADIKTPDTKLPSNLTFNISNNENISTDKDELLGINWNGEHIENISVRFMLDPDRNLYSKEYFCKSVSDPAAGNVVYIKISSTESTEDLSNLKVELLFDVVKNGIKKSYIFRQHFNRIVRGDLFSFDLDGQMTDNIKPDPQESNSIASFYIAKAYFDKGTMEKQYGDGGPVEKVEITDDLPSVTDDMLCDYCGNMYEPYMRCAATDEATRLQRFNDVNVRAWMDQLPTAGNWMEGDEIIKGSKVYRYTGGSWSQCTFFVELQPIPIS